MKRFRIGIISFLLTAILWILSFPTAAFAAGADVAISISPQSPQVGDLFTVKLTFSSSKAIGSFQASLTYDKSRMEYVSGGGNAVELSGGTGGIVDNGSSTTKQLSYSLRFRAIKSGQASFAVTSTEINDYNTGKNLGDLEKSAPISIAAKSTATPSSPTPTPSSEEPIPVTVDGKTLYVMRDIKDVVLPDDFSVVTIPYHDVDIQAALHPLGLTLLSVIDAGGNADFYIYDANTDALCPYVTIPAGEFDCAILPLGDVSVTGYLPTTITIDGQTAQALASESITGFYLVHAQNNQGNSGYYFYDSIEGTMQRALVNTDAATPQPLVAGKSEPTAKPDVWMFLILAGACIALLTFVGLKFRRYKRLHHSLSKSER